MSNDELCTILIICMAFGFGGLYASIVIRAARIMTLIEAVYEVQKKDKKQ